jgi:flagellar hook-associated protein FlgK
MIQSAQGLQTADAQFDQVARNIAEPQDDLVSLSTQAVALLQAKDNFEANLKTLEVSDQMTQTLLKAVG